MANNTFSGLFNYFTAPPSPNTALSIGESHLSMISLSNGGKGLSARNLGVSKLPDRLIKPHFSEPNIANESSFAEMLSRTATQAGLKSISTLSVALPFGSAKSAIVTLDAVPTSHNETDQIMQFKIERSFGLPASELKYSYKQLNDFQDRSTWLISAVHKQVIEQYERVFKTLGWKTGLITPQAIGEAQWLIRTNREDDQLMLSLNSAGFDVVIIRGEEPILIREVVCSQEERENEFYRLITYYRDRILTPDTPPPLSHALIIGSPTEQIRFIELLESALEKRVVWLDPVRLGLKVDPNAPFSRFAPAAGLATLAF